MKKYLILDFYVDEPACFGVPPFVAPYPRYIYGALIDAGVPSDAILYKSVDHLRSDNFQIEGNFTAVFLVGGAVVPGKYLGQKIGTINEIGRTLENNGHLEFYAGGLAAHQLDPVEHPHLQLVSGDIEQCAFDFATCGDNHCVDLVRTRSNESLKRWAPLGAAVVAQHQGFPDLICEIETYRGCPRSSHCSFCSEQMISREGAPDYRLQEDILHEVDTLIESGISRFRLGRQADILAYGSRCEEFRATFPRPEPTEVIPLFQALHERRLAGRIQVLNVDNANPGTILHYEQDSFDILSAIAQAVSPGDTLPLGVESFDPKVVAANNLKVNKGELLRVVALMNSAGGFREEGIPKLLPGINLIHGLKGEDASTFKTNFEALREIVEKDLLLRRINIRTLLPFPGTDMKYSPSSKVINRYRYYRDRIRKEVDTPMLKRVFPTGAILSNVRIEGERNGVSYGRQLASYAITVKVKRELPQGSFHTMAVCGQEERSLRSFPVPLHVNSASTKQFEAIEGIGRKRAGALFLSRPFLTREEFFESAEALPELLKSSIEL